jgi:uncharacterized protein YegP (UPF0339 family)
VTFIIYKDHRKEWRWSLRARNGKKIADCGEGYRRRAHAKKMVERIIIGPHEIAQ